MGGCFCVHAGFIGELYMTEARVNWCVLLGGLMGAMLKRRGVLLAGPSARVFNLFAREASSVVLFGSARVKGFLRAWIYANV